MPKRLCVSNDFHDDPHFLAILPLFIHREHAVEDGVAILKYACKVLPFHLQEELEWHVRFNFDLTLCSYHIKHLHFLNWWCGFDPRSLDEIAADEGVNATSIWRRAMPAMKIFIPVWLACLRTALMKEDDFVGENFLKQDALKKLNTVFKLPHEYKFHRPKMR